MMAYRPKFFLNIAQRQISDFYKVEYNNNYNCYTKDFYPPENINTDYHKYSSPHGMLAFLSGLENISKLGEKTGLWKKNIY